MRKLTFAVAVLASLGGAAFATSASAAPGAPIGVSTPETVTQVRYGHGRMDHHRGMRHGRMHRHDRFDHHRGHRRGHVVRRILRNL